MFGTDDIRLPVLLNPSGPFVTELKQLTFLIASRKSAFY